MNKTKEAFCIKLLKRKKEKDLPVLALSSLYSLATAPKSAPSRILASASSFLPCFSHFHTVSVLAHRHQNAADWITRG